MNLAKDIKEEAIKAKMQMDIKMLPIEEVPKLLEGIMTNHYKDLSYTELIAINKAMLMIKGVKFLF